MIFKYFQNFSSQDLKGTLKAHQLSSKHGSCVSLYDFQQKPSKKGQIEKLLVKVETHDIERYEKLLNTAYAVMKHNQSYTF